jgi:serine/threonine-protein kinase
MAGSAVADPRDLERVGTVLDEKWTLEKLLGAGGMGAVYLARHRNGAKAAVKVLHPDLARVSEVRDRFLREGYAANRVEHKGAVRVLDDDVVESGPAAGTTYLVMELLEGESLDERARRQPPLGERELLEITEGVLDVLEAAHARGVIHRDLKPENLFLARDDEDDRIRVKVLDFGLARVADTGQATNAGRALGTPSFMSPEQAAGDTSAIDGRTDIFALGSTLFQLTSGRRIHEADNIVALVLKMASLPAPPFKTVVPSASDAFARIVDRALQFEKTDRYPDAAAMRADVRAALEEIGGTSSLKIVRAMAPSQLATTEISASDLDDAPSDIGVRGTELAMKPPSPASLREAQARASEKQRATVPAEERATAAPPSRRTVPEPASRRSRTEEAAPASVRESVPSAPWNSVPAAPWASRAEPEERRVAPAESAEREFFAEPARPTTAAYRDSSPPSEDSASISSAPRERPQRSRLWMLVVMLLGGIGVWLMWPDIKVRLAGVSQLVPADIVDAGASLLGADAGPGATDASAGAAPLGATDAAAAEDAARNAEPATDASAGGGDGGARMDEDAGAVDEDDDEDDDVDAGGPSATDGGAPRPAAAPPAHPAAKPTPRPAAAKPKPPRKPGAPGKPRKKRR